MNNYLVIRPLIISKINFINMARKKSKASKNKKKSKKKDKEIENEIISLDKDTWLGIIAIVLFAFALIFLLSL